MLLWVLLAVLLLLGLLLFEIRLLLDVPLLLPEFLIPLPPALFRRMLFMSLRILLRHVGLFFSRFTLRLRFGICHKAPEVILTKGPLSELIPSSI
jgi:hypothetical protein